MRYALWSSSCDAMMMMIMNTINLHTIYRAQGTPVFWALVFYLLFRVRTWGNRSSLRKFDVFLHIHSHSRTNATLFRPIVSSFRCSGGRKCGVLLLSSFLLANVLSPFDMAGDLASKQRQKWILIYSKLWDSDTVQCTLLRAQTHPISNTQFSH